MPDRQLTADEQARLTPEGRIGAKRRKPPGAWTLHFVGGSLEERELWHLGECPRDWASSRSGVQERYVLRDRDDEKKLAVFEFQLPMGRDPNFVTELDDNHA
jgi:hypothetical protein